MDINTKLQQFNRSLKQMVGKEYEIREKNVKQEIKSGMEQEITEYEAKKQANYEKNKQRIEKDYHKKVYQYELQCKKEIIEEENNIKQQIQKEATMRLKEFLKTEDYQNFLFQCIEERTFHYTRETRNLCWFDQRR